MTSVINTSPMTRMWGRSGWARLGHSKLEALLSAYEGRVDWGVGRDSASGPTPPSG